MKTFYTVTGPVLTWPMPKKLSVLSLRIFQALFRMDWAPRPQDRYTRHGGRGPGLGRSGRRALLFFSLSVAVVAVVTMVKGPFSNTSAAGTTVSLRRMSRQQPTINAPALRHARQSVILLSLKTSQRFMALALYLINSRRAARFLRRVALPEQASRSCWVVPLLQVASSLLALPGHPGRWR
jgi:hypothetical protein